MRKAIFFDRDGTLLVEAGFITHPSVVTAYEFAYSAVRLARQRGFLVIVVTNQSGIARGFLTEEELKDVHRSMEEIFAREGAPIDAIYYCPHHPDGTVKHYRRICRCRKPSTGLGEQAIANFEIDPRRSFMIGDKVSDVIFGMQLGVRPCLVLTGYGAEEAQKLGEVGLGHVPVFQNVLEAVKWILQNEHG